MKWDILFKWLEHLVNYLNNSQKRVFYFNKNCILPLDKRLIYCYNLPCMTAEMCEVADTLGLVVKYIPNIRLFARSESILDIGEGRTWNNVKRKSSYSFKSIWS
mgnify:CR=1 FL=1